MFFSGGAKADHILPLYLADVKPGMTRHEVVRTLGRPDRITAWRFQGQAYEREWHYPDRFTVGFQILNGVTRRVIWVRTGSPKDKFPYGIHVGAKERRVRRLGNTDCWRLTSSVGTFPRGWICAWRPPWIADPCGPHLTFRMRNRHGRVALIQLSGIRGGLPQRAGERSGMLPLDGCI